MEDLFRRVGIATPRPLIESTSAFTNLRLVAAGLGLSAVPESTLRSAHSTNEVRRVHVKPGLPPAPVALLSRAGVNNGRVELLRTALQRSASAFAQLARADMALDCTRQRRSREPKVQALPHHAGGTVKP